jgi:hypothetical protein
MDFREVAVVDRQLRAPEDLGHERDGRCDHHVLDHQQRSLFGAASLVERRPNLFTHRGCDTCSDHPVPKETYPPSLIWAEEAKNS